MSGPRRGVQSLRRGRLAIGRSTVEPGTLMRQRVDLAPQRGCSASGGRGRRPRVVAGALELFGAGDQLGG